MNTLELIRFLSDSANEAIDKATSAEGNDVSLFLDEAEELLALGHSIILRTAINQRGFRKAA